MRLFHATGLLFVCLAFFIEQMNAVVTTQNFRQERETCRTLARQVTTQESNFADIAFFKQCIVDYFKFRGNSKVIYSLPTIHLENFYNRNPKKTPYMKAVAKRIERFFIRNGNWHKILRNKAINGQNEKDCSNLLYITAAKYAYALYVLNFLRHRYGCNACIESGRTYKLKSYRSVCYIKLKTLTCGGNLELNLLGGKSGSLTALFHQFFREPIGESRRLPGFRQDPDILMGLRISAFGLEKVSPILFKTPNFFDNFMLMVAVKKMKNNIQMKMLSVAVAIYRMKPFSGKFFNELLSDQSPLRVQIHLARAFQYWSVELASFASKINSFMQSSHYNYDLNYRRRHNIAFELITGRLQNRNLPDDWVRNLAQHAICLIYNVPVYLTPGAVRHSVIMEKYIPVARRFEPDVEDHWQSMLENWAMVNRVYKKECVQNNLLIRPCLLKMSKSLHLMFDAMTKSRLQLKKMRKAIGGEVMVDFKDVSRITESWVKNYRDKGYFRLPTVRRSRGPVGSRKIPKKPFFMTSQSHDDDFPELRDLEELPRELANITGGKQLDDHIKGSADLQKGNVEGLGEGKQLLDEDIEGSMNGHLNKDKKPLDNAGVEKNEPQNEKTEGLFQTEPLDEGFNDVDDSYAMKSLTDDALSGLRNDNDGSQGIKPLDTTGRPEGSQEEEIYDDDRKWSGVFQTSPLTPEILDLDENDEGEEFLTHITPPEVRPVFVTFEAPTESPVSRTSTDEDMEKPMDEEKGTTDASLAESESAETTESTMETLPENDMSMMKPQDNNDGEMPPDDEMQDTAGSAMAKQMDKDTKETVGLPTTKPLDEDSKETVGLPTTKPLHKDSKETVGLPTTKPLHKDSKETVGLPTTKPLHKDSKETVGLPTTKLQDAKVKTISKLLKAHVKKTTDTAIKEEPTKDDFPEHPASMVPVVLEKSEQKKLGTGRKQPKLFLSYFRRRRYSYVSRRRRAPSIYVSRRRRSTYVSRRRRSTYVSRRRRSTYVSRRRRTNRPPVKSRKRPSPKPRRHDETGNIRKFLLKFGCHVGGEISKMALSDGCMDKIQSHVRRYNRYAFSYIATKNHHSRPTSSEKQGDGVPLKTEL